ncbi:hypothetical protein JYK00_08220 [Thermosipho ferrireducens]|uniref:Phospholipase C/D domain-containing protein n=1 Tax=Thermosipho ferrireducens TaxID=2571116 RepID=A0ABX7S7D1_9BACT|nr:hypothetical protein [Thermosipho ferrireducens]QTA37700.1 hypothetical protein JYK00_08220 [Thermosipho ferrireducens]
MPSILAHVLFSTKMVPSNKWGPVAFMAAQGPDVFFYLQSQRFQKIGNELHKVPSKQWKTFLSDLPEDFREGFYSHLLLDEILHPEIMRYYPSGKEHTKFEFEFDELLSNRYFNISFAEHKWWKLLDIRIFSEYKYICEMFDEVVYNNLGLKVNYKEAVEAMIKSLKLLYNLYPIKRKLFAPILKIFGKDYTYLFPEVSKDDLGKLESLYEIFLNVMEE